MAITNKESTAKEKQPLKELAITNKESTITGCRKKSKTEGDQMNTRGRRWWNYSQKENYRMKFDKEKRTG